MQDLSKLGATDNILGTCLDLVAFKCLCFNQKVSLLVPQVNEELSCPDRKFRVGFIALACKAVANPPAVHLQVPIRRMDAPRPVAPSTEAKPQGAQKRPLKKRRQAVAGGSTVLAALFCLFIYCGVGIPGISTPTRDLQQALIIQQKALAEVSTQGLPELESRSRSLQAALPNAGQHPHLQSCSWLITRQDCTSGSIV